MSFLSALRNNTARPLVPLIALAATLALGWHLNAQGRKLDPAPISLQRTWNSEAATAIVRSWEKQAASVQIYWDFPFIAAYAVLLLSLGYAAARHASRCEQPQLEKLARWAAYAGLLAGFFDVIENIGLLTMISSSAAPQPLPALTWSASSIKFLLIGASLLTSGVILLRLHRPSRPDLAFEQIFKSEYEDIFARDSSVLKGDTALPEGRDGGNQRTVKNGLVGLALSGGGIRSAAFSLGGLQALHKYGILARTHYLSTVSGGGYIGSAVTVGMSVNKGEFPYGKLSEDIGETPATRWLRDHSRYLVQNGAISVLSALVIYLRGIVANILFVAPLVLAVAAAFVWWVPDSHVLKSGRESMLALTALAITTGLLVIYAIGVSVFPIIPLQRRGVLAAVAAVVLCLAGTVVLYDLHGWLLNALFESLAKPSEPRGTDIFSFLISSTKALIAVVVASLGGIFPFIKQIASAAVSDKKAGVSDALKRWGSRALLIIVAAIVPLLTWLLLMQFVFWGIGRAECVGAEAERCLAVTWAHAPDWFQALIGSTEALGPPSRIEPWRLYAMSAAVLFGLACCLSVNANSLHQLYRDRLGSAFLGAFAYKLDDKKVSADTFRLQDIKTEYCPYHLINAALNVPGSDFANRRGRNADFFVFSKKYSGSEMTGYVDTARFEQAVDGLNIGTAMAISGAAAAPNMGMASMRPLSPTIAFLNVRLGRWLKHPQGIEHIPEGESYIDRYLRWWRGTPGLTYFFREAFSKSGSDLNPDGFMFLTDGGHIENLGIYELLRRRCKIIIAIDGEADPNLDGGSLIQLERFARIDLGTAITMDWKGIAAMTRKVDEDIRARKHDPHSGPHVALGLIDYPGLQDGAPRESGLLVYVKASLSGDEEDYVLSYKATNAGFPHETTLDQFFSEEQFECYRALGEHIVARFLSGQDPASPKAANRAALVKMFNETFSKADVTIA